ncbi:MULTISPECIES: nicotinate-nicotinamide nucleotide adenylyltransferase [unclassified Psychrobacter]|uniref:nicotinate-nicotinamide nucleotide adenylyltransferase n=1 Tax=unclassified Psychrobacter TaxID=196806 RepID=UPI00071E84ED|nr:MULTISPECIES: nicotinate-nicotinamide nucleotide adenylyltransferase [unclassified Psychrobacter]OLF37604.1 nicotinate-nicotinamide nucleotide adenylyltransferase [Psychrobacter sp. Cmf 22.2]
MSAPNLHKDDNLTSPPAIRAYLGGSFDPVHKGHLQIAMRVYQVLLPIAERQQRELHVSLLPNARSPFKDESTNPKHRLAMLKLVTTNTPLQINELELWQTPPVYTINSVQTLRERHPNDSLIFIMGMDSARSLDMWKDGLNLTNYVNLWIFNRTKSSNLSIPSLVAYTDNDPCSLSLQDIDNLYSELPKQLQAQTTRTVQDLVQPFNGSAHNRSSFLKSASRGRIYIDQHQVSAISSTEIRKQLQKRAARADTAPNTLIQLINPTVYQYIIAHQLYSAVQFR